MVRRPKILLINSFGEKLDKLAKSFPFDVEAITCDRPQQLSVLLALESPDLIVTIRENTESEFYNILNSFDYSINNKWVDCQSFVECNNHITDLVDNAYTKFVGDVPADSQPLFSVCVPVYKANDQQVYQIYKTVKNQTFKNWELVLYDTNCSHLAKFAMRQLCGEDPRVHYYENQDWLAEGNIGRTKHNCFSLASGKYLIEMDHDDELTPNALEILAKCITWLPQAKFMYTDCWERNVEDNTPVDYGDTYAFGLGKKVVKDDTEVFTNTAFNPYQLESYNRTPELCYAGLHHIISVPNHMRVWERAFYHQIGGHCKSLSICDDYELILRTMLNVETKYNVLHVAFPLYIQNMHGETNSQEPNRDFIQQLVPYVWTKYGDKLNDKWLENQSKIDEPILEYWNRHSGFENIDLDSMNVVADTL